MRRSDKYYMTKALALAHKAGADDEVPVGAVVVDSQGLIVGRGYNQTERLHCQTAHAEMRAIGQACRARADWRLDDCWLYVTLEPCAMCMGLVRLSRLAGVVYGASSPLFGYGLDNEKVGRVYNSKPYVIGGVCAEPAAALLKKFFKQKRA